MRVCIAVWRFSSVQFACTLLEGRVKEYTMRVCVRVMFFEIQNYEKFLNLLLYI